MKWKDALIGYVLGRAMEGGLKAALRATGNARRGDADGGADVRPRRRGLSRADAVLAARLARERGAGWGTDNDMVEMFQDPYWPEKQKAVIDTLSELLGVARAAAILLAVVIEALRDTAPALIAELPQPQEIRDELPAAFDEHVRERDSMTRNVYRTFGNFLGTYIAEVLQDPRKFIPTEIVEEDRPHLDKVFSLIRDARRKSPDLPRELADLSRHLPSVLADWATSRPASYCEVLARLVGALSGSTQQGQPSAT